MPLALKFPPGALTMRNTDELSQGDAPSQSALQKITANQFVKSINSAPLRDIKCKKTMEKKMYAAIAAMNLHIKQCNITEPLDVLVNQVTPFNFLHKLGAESCIDVHIPDGTGYKQYRVMLIKGYEKDWFAEVEPVNCR